MRHWIKIQDKEYGQVMVHEIRCPYCGYKETYTRTEAPSACYRCENRLETPE